MRNYDDFLIELNAILPLPKNNIYVSADGTIEVDLKKAGKNINKAIKKYKKENKLSPAEVAKIKLLVIDRYFNYRKAIKD
ncbi:MAG: hypothetical protein V4581_00815 [Bacteroidota bacterium]